ncbi:PIGR protein, partial [Pterocles burchelli]|nr:PIGR protein [Pterocles burchelli]
AQQQLPSPSPHLVFTGLQAQTSQEESQPEGSTLYIQCPYTPQTDYDAPKVWYHVRDGGYKILVESNAHTTHTKKGKVTIQDNHTHRTVSITMADLQVEDSGTYYCAYHFGGWYNTLKTISLNVFKELHRWELDSLSVQCPYSPGTNVWCRRGGTGCNIVARTDTTPTSRNSKALGDRTSIQRDTQQRTVTITMQKLQAQDAGVYWCALYSSYGLTRIMEVRLSVSKSEYPLAALWQISAPARFPSRPPPHHVPQHSSLSTFILLLGVLSVLFILALISPIILCVRQHKEPKRRGTREAEDIYEKPEDTAQLDSAERMESPKDDSEDLKYVTLSFKPQLSLEEPLYCNVEPSQTPRKPEDESVEYAVIALK